MNRMIRLFLAAACLIILCAGTANAEGGINWKVTFTNPADEDVMVFVHAGLIAPFQKANIPAHGTQTFEFGANCPSAMGGKLRVRAGRDTQYSYDTYVEIQSTDMNGTPMP